MELTDDPTFPIFLGTAIISALVIFILIFVVLYRKAQLRFELERHRYRHALLESEVEIRSETLKSLSRDLHDNFGQILSLVKMNLAFIAPRLEKEDREKLKDTNELISNLLVEIRTLSPSLDNGSFENQKLGHMIQKDLERIQSVGAIEVVYRDMLNGTAVKNTQKVFLYRMFQEVINNALKHSEAQKLEVCLRKAAGNIELNIKDNGKGFKMEETTPGKGLSHLKERCSIIGAKCLVQSYPGEGTEINLKLPT